MARQPIPTAGIWSNIAALLNQNAVNAEDDTGWGQYADTQYPTGSPFLLLKNTDTLIPNNGASVIDSEKPSDVTTFYDGAVITGRNGDSIAITIDMVATPTNTDAKYIELWFDIGLGDLYRRIISLPKGAGVDRPLNFSVYAYTLGTWEANGAKLYARADGDVNITNIRYVIARTHKAR